MVHFFVPPEYEDSLSRVIVSLLDVNPRKRAEEALMDSEERYRILAENSREGVVVVQDSRIKYINESMGEIFGYSLTELTEIRPLQFAHPDDKERVAAELQECLEDRKKEAFVTFRIITGQGDVKWLTLSIKPISWGGRDAQLEILTDITQHKVLETQLLQAHAEMEDRVNKRTAELSKANEQLKAEAEEHDKAQQHILALTQDLIRIQENERQRIARDLHDNVAQDLSSIMLKMETLFDDHADLEGQLKERGEAVAAILSRAISSVRDIAYGLRPPILDQLGLTKALETLCMDAGGKNEFEVDFVATGMDNIDLDYDTQINIYRMIQEAMRNITCHANADKATVRIVKSHPDLLIRIEDNGCGFAVHERASEAITEKRMGLRSMEERARYIGGSMEIQSLEGTGTRVFFRVPIARRKET